MPRFTIFPLAIVLLLVIPLAQGVEPAQIGCNVFSAFQGEDSIWFTTNDKGVYLFSPSIGTMDHLVATVDIPVNETTCGIIALERIWLGTDEGLYYSDADDMVWAEVDENQLPSAKINCMAVDEESLWVGTPKGAAKLESGSWRAYTKSDGMGDDWVMDVEVHGEQVWFGTLRGGISRYTPSTDTWESWDTGEGLISRTVFSISCSDSRVFVATASGFSVFDLGSEEFANYGFGQLPSSSVTCCAWSDELEQAWIGTGKGIAIWQEGEQNLTVIQEVGEIKLGKINGMEVLDGMLWVMRSTTEWFYHRTTGVLGYDLEESRWIRPTFLDVLIDQSGYSPGHPKEFLVQCNKPLDAPGGFRVLSGAGKEVYQGPLSQRIDQENWGAYYWKGNFSELKLRGNFTIEVTIGEVSGKSYRFEIDNDVLLEECGELIYDFLNYMKCGVVIPGYRPKPCHLDDAVLPNGTHIDATGGWHCAGLWGGKYSEYHTYVLFNLLFAMDIRPEFFEPIDRDGDGLSDILNHAMWGCDFMMKMQMNNGSIFHEVEKIEVTDGIIGNNDDRPISGWMPVHNGLLAVADMAGTSALIEGHHPEVADHYLQGALRSFGNYHPMVSEGQGSSVDTAAAVMACLQLHRATGNSTYIELAEHYCDLALDMDYSTYYGPFVPCALGYYLELNPSTEHSQRIKDYIIAHADNRISSDTAPDDELRPFDIPSVRNYKMDPEAAPALFAYNYTGNISYLEYGLGILDFHLGKNPYGICMLEGTGTRNVPGYANDYQLGHATDSPYSKANPDNPGGAHPGAIPQGIVMREGRPFYETSMNPGFQFGETWLINTHFLQPIVLVPEDTGSYPLEVDETPLVSTAFLVILCLILFHERVVHPGEAY